MCSIQHENLIYTIYDDFFMKFTKNSDNMITSIQVDNCDVIKYNDIKCPFKFFFPENASNLIYIKNGLYHVRYFSNKNFIPKNSSSEYIRYGLCGYKHISSEKNEKNYVFTVNNNNLFFPNYMEHSFLKKNSFNKNNENNKNNVNSEDELQNFQKICGDYGMNSY